MQKAPALKRRPCRICRRWFLPNPKLRDRQRTCGDEHCKREWHRRKCAAWNQHNADYFRANYLHHKLDDAAQSQKVSQNPQPKSRLKSGLPLHYVQEVIGIQHLVIIEYLAQLLIGRFQEVLGGQVIGMTTKTNQLPRAMCSRGDRL